ncbi:MAG: O-antigen ligase family protein, partial [Caulobacteraceae bacterium]
EKNALGAINTFGLIFCTAAAILVPKRKWIWLAFSVLCFGLILMSTSKTSLLAALLALSCMAFVLMFRAGRVWAVISVWGAVSVALALTGLVFAAPELLFQAIGKDATLTGRTELWAAALHQWESHKLLGFGYSVFWERLSPWSPVEWVVHDAGFYVGHAHNGWLETLLSLGLVGIAVWSLCYLEIVIRALCSVVSSPGAYVILPFLVVFTLRSITEVAIIDFHDIEWLLFIAAAVKIASPRSWEEDRAELAETG